VRDPRGRLALPEGFRYTLVAESGVTRLDTGEPTPDAPDGSASFVRRGGNGSVLINNHEIRGKPKNPVPHVAGLVYDPPWNTWLSCEETDVVPGAGNTFRKRHGYVSEVDPHHQAANRNPRPIKALGRFQHEAVAVDPGT
jgi:secreted PhoX family phosphatase